LWGFGAAAWGLPAAAAVSFVPVLDRGPGRRVQGDGVHKLGPYRTRQFGCTVTDTAQNIIQPVRFCLGKSRQHIAGTAFLVARVPPRPTRRTRS